MPVYMYHLTHDLQRPRENIHCQLTYEPLYQYTNSKSFEKYKITPIDAKIVSYFLNNVCF